MKNKINFSVIIPIYKVEKYLRQCINSVLNQTYKNFEIILVDDGSPDGCPQVCDEYKKQHKNIKVIHKENGGLSDARNVGLKEAFGEYIIFLDSDDYWNDNLFLENAFKIISKENSDLFVFGMQKYFEDIDIYKDKERNIGKSELIVELIKNNHFKASACDKIIKSKIIKDNNIVFPLGYKSEDIKWTYDILRFCKKISFYNKNIYVYRQRSESITKTVEENNIRDMIKIINYCVDDCKKNKYKNEEILLSFVAYEYCVALGLISSKKCKNNISNEIKKELYCLKYLLKYDISKKVKLVKLFNFFWGIKLTSKLMGYFIDKKEK